MIQEETVVVARLDDLPQGSTRVVRFDETEVLLCHTAEGIFAVQNLCSHAAEPLFHGKLKGHRIICPLHGAAFDVRDGSALSRPASVALTAYPVTVDGDAISLGAPAARE